ncbi:transient receptor potential cation channel subfamily V member 6-like [Diadema setosum]|uniref:transient receptor potential cation channel subfamily V member 6-like n=1 Tax=Diadema setosum TaxID=31175 RepID=UPI003B3A4374
MLRRFRAALQGALKATDPDAEWRKQNEAAEENPMYQLLYLNGGGILVTTYQKMREGRLSVEDFRDFIVQQVEKMLYDGGRGRSVSREEFARYKWEVLEGNKNSINDHDLMENFKNYQDGAINKFEEHELCFDLYQRGAIGETILHLCYLNDTPMHSEIARHLLELYPKLVLDVYEGSDFYGESALHLAIVNNDVKSVKLLVGRYRARLDQRARGRFFRPDDLKEQKYIAHTKSRYEGPAYLGEYPLAFCASFGRIELYDYLIDQSLRRKPGEGRCHPNAKDSFGNTIVHMAIIHNQKLMFYHAIHHNKMPASYTIRNAAGLTPLQLSFRLGREELFTALLDLSSDTQWTYGKVAYVAYPLSLLDSIDENGKVNDDSALSVIVENESIHHLKMLEGQVISELLEVKWKKYCKAQFLFKQFWAMLHLCLLFVAVLLRPPDGFMTGSDPWSKARYVSEVCVLIGCLAKTITELLEVKSRGSIVDYLKSLLDFPTKALFMISIFLLFACIPVRLLGLERAENYMVMIIVPLSWSYLLFFFRGYPSLGPMVVVFFKMLGGDLFRFSVIYFIILAVFAQAFFFLFIDSGAETSSFSTVPETFISTFIMTVGEFEWNLLYQCRMPWLAIVLFVIFMWFVSVLMLNMVIAMMARTFDIIEERSRMEWKRQWAMIVLNVERSILRTTLAKHRKEYSVKIKVKQRAGNIESEEPPQTSKKHNNRPQLRRKSTIENVVVHKFKRGTRLIHMDSIANMVTKEVEALLVEKVLPCSKAKTKRDVKKKWKTLIRNVIIQQRFGGHSSPAIIQRPRKLEPVHHRDILTISQSVPLPPIRENGIIPDS